MRGLGVMGLLLAVACTAPVVGEAPQDPGVAPAVGSVESSELNPYGIAYPSDHLGHKVGMRIPNLTFVGYRARDTSQAIDTSGQPEVLRLADFYDPLGRSNLKLLHVSAQVRWCGASNDETSMLSGFDYQNSRRTDPGVAANLAPAGVVFMDLLVDGFTPGTAATVEDLQGWVSDHQVNFATALAPAGGSFNSFYTDAAWPLNMDIDTRSMQILTLSVGYSPTMEADEKKLLAWIDTHEPMSAR